MAGPNIMRTKFLMRKNNPAATVLPIPITIILFGLLLLLQDLNYVRAARNYKHGTKQGRSHHSALGGNQYRHHSISRSLKNSGLYPSVFNVATKADIYVNATCGEEGQETFCKPSESTRCAVCDPNSPDLGKRHNVSHILDSDPSRWWQSPTLARGERYEYVTITLDLKQIYQIAYVIVKSANSPRPAAWILERSLDGQNYSPWQYYAPTDEECWTRYSVPPVNGKPNYMHDDEVVCTSSYSRPIPMENGEIHTYLTNGRPGALNHSYELEEFTQARFVRFRLQGLRSIGETIVDKRRAFYSIKEINVGGHCICSGHASHCRYSVHHGHQECECERHTCGERCDKCCPMYNQVQWRHGNSNGKSFHCEKCNCHGHANSCRYDEKVAEQKSSLDIRDKYRGGGVCVDCTEHTTGINCEKCEMGYYRPNGVLPNASEPCLPCTCNVHGSTGFCTPDDSFTRLGKVAGACECKEGYSGYKCDQCAAGYKQFPYCMPCPCDSRGILPSHDCEGDCICKSNVAGKLCDKCKNGYFSLTRDNVEGCIPCVCSGVSQQCRSAAIDFGMLSTRDGWLVTDMNTSRYVAPEIDTEIGSLAIDLSLIDYSPYWLAPNIYGGNRLTSYGSNLTFAVTWVVMRGDSSGRPTIEPDVVLVGKNGLRIAYGEERYSGQDAMISVPLYERGWYHVKEQIPSAHTRLRRTEFRGDPVTRFQILSILADLEHVLIRARYHSEQIEGSLLEAVLTTGEIAESGGEGEGGTLVEKCECPIGHEGISCEKCSWGYTAMPSNNTDFYQGRMMCVRCDCNMHAASCDLVMGECGTCEHNTVGSKCDRCETGYYGDPSKGTDKDCKKCSCPLNIESNNFSPICQIDEPGNLNGGYVCTQCPEGYTGDHCESCDVGYFGDPKTPGKYCEPCSCNGGQCDQETGRCLECRGNTEGWKCERCKELHYGNPFEPNCKPCNCDSVGSLSSRCDSESGQCLCKPLFASRTCSNCVHGYGNVTAGCSKCDCGLGAVDNECDPVTGECDCLRGVEGPTCNNCGHEHYGLSSDGCFGCKCNVVGSIGSTCDIVTGQCQCKPRVTGRSCDRCQNGFWGIASGTGCTPCECHITGAINSSCEEDTGHCHCKPGVGGPRCNSCLPGYYGFSDDGCQLCEPCNKPGHICDPDTGRCVCPTLTLGENCDRCRSGSYGFTPGTGCKSCSCGPGATKSQCDTNGQCNCRDGFEGLRCERCAVGYYGYPRCRPCGCLSSGTVRCEDGICACDKDTGQCPCKENVIGRQCNECKTGTYGLTLKNLKGCTECFCFGRSNSCREAGLRWGQRRLPRTRNLYTNDTVNEITLYNFGTSHVIPFNNGGLNVTNGYSIIPEVEGDLTLPSTLFYNHPLYWTLPKSFLGDKIVSYGGYIRFTTETFDGTYLPSNFLHPLIVLQGNDRIILEHYPQSSVKNNTYKIRLHESFWQLRNRADVSVTREILMIALQNLQQILIKASDYREFKKTTLSEVSMDAAVLTPTQSPPFATDVEICECPAEYNGTSCQDPSRGYYRYFHNKAEISSIVVDLVGRAEPCRCNGRSGLCDVETGHCTDCGEDTVGERCQLCADSFYGHPDFGGCKSCPCPHADKRFSSTCEIHSDVDVVCHCKPGYTGNKCERCSYGYYGAPTVPGGSCVSCNCNPAGSLNEECSEINGQCNCRQGSTGRDCSQCTEHRHVFIEDVCTSCDDNCTGILLDFLNDISTKLIEKTVHISNGYIPPPWEDLSYVNENVSRLSDDLKHEKQLKQKMRNVPWREYKKLRRHMAEVIERATNLLNEAGFHKSRGNDIKNNIYSVELEIGNVRRKLQETTIQLHRYGDKDSSVEIDNAIKLALITLDDVKKVNLSGRTNDIEILINDTTDYIDWIESFDDGESVITDIKRRANRYNEKISDFKMIIENVMENLFIYDKFYESNKMGFNDAKNLYVQSNNAKGYTTGSIEDGKIIVDEARGFLVDSENNFQDLPGLKNKLINLTEDLTMKEGILYRLNYEYEDIYVLPAKSHARNLSRYVDQCVSLFAETHDAAVNPLKASQAYKNIADSLYSAKIIGQESKIISEEINNKIFYGGGKLDSLIEITESMVVKSSKLLNEAKKQEKPTILLKNQLESQKQSITDLKNTLNGTGIKDNIINVNLRELKSSSVDSQIYLQKILSKNEAVMSVFNEKTTKAINDYEDLIESELKPKLNELKEEGDSKISLASEKLTEAQGIIKIADAKLISLTNASIKRKNEFDKWNDTLATKLQYLKDRITEARNTADGIRISLKSVDDKKCVRSYRPSTLNPGTTNNIVITLAIENKHRQGVIFYLPSSVSDDFIAIEMVNRRIRFLWNVGGGTGLVTHPEIIEAGDIQDDNYWYRIEAERTRNVGKLSVRKQTSTSGKYLPVLNSTNPDYGRFDVTQSDRVWLGGIPESQTRPSELTASNGLPGCVHQVILDGKPVGLWNFVTNAPDMACEACVEGVENARDDIAYSFNGEGYAVRKRVASGPYSKYTFGVSITFRTFDENALLFLAINPTNSQHIMIFLREGRVVLNVGYGGNISMEMLSVDKYNNGNWTKIDALRQYQLRKGIEQCSLSINGNGYKRVGAPTPQPKKEDIPDLVDANYYIGGVPPSFKIKDNFILNSATSFLGCMSNIFVQEGYDPMAEQYYGVEPSCGNKHVKIVGFYGDGYYEHNSHTLKKISSSFSFSFRTLQDNAVLLLSTIENANEDKNKDIFSYEQNHESYYSVVVTNGRIELRVNAGKGEVVLKSNDTYNDGKYHSISVTKRRKEVELRVDDAYQNGGRLPTGAAVKATELNGGLYLGGIPDSINDTNFVSTKTPLIGAIKDVIFNDEIIRLDEPVSFRHAAIGRAGPSMGKDQVIHTPSASLSRGMSTQPEGCEKVPYYSLEPGALKFGDKPHSHTQLYLNFKKFWEKKYVIEFDFRTYYPNGLLFITPGIRLKHYLIMSVRNGQLSLLIKSKQRKEITFKGTFNDGNWHHVVIRHDERRLTMSVDGETPQLIKVQKKIGLVTMMYIGGLPESGTPIPEQVVVKLETLKGCIRGLKVNGNLLDMVGSTSRAYNVGQCFPNVETGAYFQDDAHAVYNKNFELGAVLELQLEFRTSEFSGVLLSITAPGGSPSLSLELYNGKVIMSGDLGGDNNHLNVEQDFSTPYTICDNRWHRIQALYNDEQLALKVDELDQKYGLPINGNYHFTRGEVISSPLYIGGLPENAAKGTLITRDNFNGCIRNVMIGGERRDWTDMTELHNIHLSSCPIQQ